LRGGISQSGASRCYFRSYGFRDGWDVLERTAAGGRGGKNTVHRSLKAATVRRRIRRGAECATGRSANVTPYTRYFLSFIIQFQFQKALCQAAGFTGPLHECSIYGNKEAGRRFMAMLAAGASRPWQDTFEKLTGTRKMDAAAINEYFAPLAAWLREQNKGQTCGWSP
jgi:hypothetical protein